MQDPNTHMEIMRELQSIRDCINETKSSLDSRISDTRELIQNEIHGIRTELLAFQAKTQQLDDLTAWSTQFRETVTLAEIERLRQDVEALKLHKAKSMVIFAVAQFLMAGGVAWFTSKG